jgi:hypothetical protein
MTTGPRSAFPPLARPSNTYQLQEAAPIMRYYRESFIYSYQVANYVCTTSFVILLYDSIITIADEVSGINCSTFKTHDSVTFVKVQVVWPGALSFPKLLYYINRYLMIALSLYCASGQYIDSRWGIIPIPIWEVVQITVRSFRSTAKVFYY